MRQSPLTQRNARPLVMGRHGAVACGHPAAALVGIDVLRAGGNAVDAATAVSMALGVVEPHMSGLGGDGFFHVVGGRSGRSVVYNGAGAAPLSASPERFPDGIPERGAPAASTPGLLAAVGAMHARHGRRPWRDLVAPAVELARDGVAVTHNYRRFAGSNRDPLRRDEELHRVYLCGADGAPPVGALLVQDALAATLREIADGGAETFYRGSLGRRIAAGIAAARGLVGDADLAACRHEQQAPIAVTYRGFEVRQTPPNSMGFTLLQGLRILERFDVRRLGWGSAALLHLIVEARKRAFVDRERFAGDPRDVAIPLDRLLSEETARLHAAAIDPDRAAGIPAGGWGQKGDTSYFCVVDRVGNAVSAIQSLGTPFGAACLAGDTGILLNNRMTHWNLEPGHPNRLAPGRRVRQTMTAPIILRDGRFWAAFGTPGGDHQVPVLLMIVLGLIDFDMDPQALLEAPRPMIIAPRNRPGVSRDDEELVAIERDIGAEAMEGLAARGHRVAGASVRAGAGGVSLIRMLDNGVRVAATDPRMDGWAAAY